jgi:hypothetical protein
VVIPYLASYDLVAKEGATTRFGVSFGYSDCLKWGYNNSIQLAAFDAVQAADILGLDLARVRRSTTLPALPQSWTLNLLLRFDLGNSTLIHLRIHSKCANWNNSQCVFL